MRHIATFAIVVLVVYASHAQSPTTPSPGQSIWTWHQQFIADPANQYQMDEEGSAWQLHRRAMDFWGPRLYPTGDPSIAGAALSDYLGWIAGHPKASSSFPSTWSPLGPFDVPAPNAPVNKAGTGQIHSIAFQADYATSGVMYCASGFGGLFKSTDHGLTWTCITDHAFPLAGVADIEVDPTNPSILYAATGDPEAIGNSYTAGIYRSVDAGSTWSPINQGLLSTPTSFLGMHWLALRPGDPADLLCCTSAGIFRTTNANAADPANVTWTGPAANSADPWFKSLVHDPSNPQVVYASGTNVLRSLDGGSTWGSITAGYGLDLSIYTNQRIAVDVERAPPYRLFAFIGSESPNAHYTAAFDPALSTRNLFPGQVNSGNDTPSWTCIAARPGFAGQVSYGTTELQNSATGGSTVNAIDVYWDDVHPDNHALAYSPNGSELWVGCDGGLFKTNDVDASIANTPSLCQFLSRNTGLAVTTIYSSSSDPTGGRELIGTQNDANLLHTQIGSQHLWAYVDGGDGGAVEFAPDGKHAWTWVYNDRKKYKKWNASLTSSVGYFYDAAVPTSCTSNNIPCEQCSGYTGICGAWGADEFPPMGFHPGTGQWYFGVADSWLENDINDTPNHTSDFTRLSNTRNDLPIPPGFVSWFDANCVGLGHRNLIVAPSDPNKIYFSTSGVPDASCSPSGSHSWLFRSRQDMNGVIYPVDGPQPRFEPCTMPGPFTSNPTEITGFQVDASDADHLFISFSGYNADLKVYESFDGGNSWDNLDLLNSLPNLPTNDLVFHDGTDGGLYVAMDIGVYYKNASMSDWEPFFETLPNVQVNDLDINHCKGKVVAGTWGRGLWESDLAEYPTKQLLVNADAQWSGHVNATQTIKVQNGATLTVSGELTMPPGTDIIVEPGARLVVDGGTITNSCGNFWGGIQAWGTSSQHQYPASHPTYQALVELKNGAVIENARNGIQTMNPADWSMVGGVVKATDATFHNCHKAVSFVAYDNWNPNQPDPLLPNHRRNNQSRFTRCHFYVDDAYPGGDDFEAHVSMWKVQGINFRSCKFENLQTSSTGLPNTITESHKLGMGIYSLDAGFKVYSPCTAWLEPQHICNDPNAQPSEFRGLDHGIHALGGETGLAFSVTGATFENNVAGVYVNGVIGYSVVGNSFTLGNRDVNLTHADELFWEQHHRGVYSTEAYGFAIDRNTFTQAGTQLTEGLVVGYSRDHNDVAFHNAANNLKRAYIGEGICADPASSYAAIRGLWFLCNENNGNEYDFWSRLVTSDDPILQPNHTIRLNQGTSQRPADNTFDQVPGPTDESDFRVTTDATLNYWHRPSGTFAPAFVTAGKVNVWQPSLLPANNCAQKVLATIPWDPQDPTLFATTPVFAHAQAERMAYAGTRYLYEQLLDGGDPDVLVQQIQQTWPSEAWSLRTELLANSPYLSTSTLLELVKQAIMPAAMLTEILVANPDATRNENFLDWLQYESGYPLPQFLVDLVVASWDDQTYRSTMEAEMALHHGELTQATNVLVQYFRQDSVGPVLDSLVLSWRLLRTPAARYAEALTWLEQDAPDSALATLQVLAAEHYLTVDGNAELGRMQLLVEFIADVHRDGRNMAQLTGSEVDALEGLIGGAYDRPASWAQNILCFHYDLCRPPLTGGEENSHRFTPPPPAQSGPAAQEPKLIVFPNPGSTFIAFEVDLQVAPVEAELVVRDAVGREIRRFRLQKTQDQVIWDVRGATPGSYTVSLVSGGVLLRTEKFVLRP